MKIIGITGGSGSGKTTFAKKLIARVGREDIKILSMDSYYLGSQPQEITTKTGKANFDHPMAFDWNLLKEHLFSLKNGEEIEIPIYDFKTSSRLDKTENMSPPSILIFEGIFTLFDQEIRDLLDIKTFLFVDSDIRFTRRLNRDVKERGRTLDSVISQYYETVRPMYEKFLAPQKQFADFIVGEETDIAADILSARLKEYYTEKDALKNILQSSIDE